MSIKGSEAGREFFLTGAKLYLDVEDALEEFRRRVQEKCARVVEARLREIGQKIGQQWSPEDIRAYQGRWSEEGQQGGLVGRQLIVQGFGHLYFYLSLCREDDRIAYHAGVSLWRQNSNAAGKLFPWLKKKNFIASVR